MTTKVEISIGSVFGDLTVIGTAPGNQREKERYVCRCTCGREMPFFASKLRFGISSQCTPCNRKANYRRAIYAVYKGMKQRCYDPRNTHYKYYGARGIKVCDRWMGSEGFDNFLVDVGIRAAGMSIDRINSDGDYGPHNWRWATPKQQAVNRRASIFLTFNGETLCCNDWDRKLNRSIGITSERRRRGYSLERNLGEPS